MSTVFGALNATDESQRRVPPAGWGPAVTGALREMATTPMSEWLTLQPGRPDGPRGDRDVTYFPPDTTPTAAEWLSAMED